MKDKQITDIDEHIKYNLGTILVQTLLIGEFSEDYMNELKKILPLMKLPDTIATMINKIIENKITKR